MKRTLHGFSTDNPVIIALQQFVTEKGSQKAAAKALGLSGPFISDVLYGRRAVSERLARRLGFRRVVRFEFVEVTK